jgi:hypothetical protein
VKCINYTGIDDIYPDIFNYNNVAIHKCLSAGFLVGDKVCVDADDIHTIGGVTPLFNTYKIFGMEKDTHAQFLQ